MSAGLGAAVVAGLREAGSREVLVRGDRRLTGEEVLAMVATATARLTAAGVRPGDTVACLYGSELESPIGRVVALALGLRYVHVLRGVPVTVAGQVMRTLRTSALLYEPSRGDEVAALLEACPVPIVRGLDADLFGPPREGVVTAPDLGDSPEIAWVTFSSGSTGERKAVAYEHRAEAAQYRVARAVFGRERWRLLVIPLPRYLPDVFVLWALASGGTAILEPDGRPERLADVAERENVTHLMAGCPAELYELADHLETRPADPPDLRLVIYGGAGPVPSRGARAARRLGAVLMQTYGTSEGGLLTSLGPRDHARPDLLASVGRAVPGVELRIRGKDGADLPSEAVGEIWVRTDQRMRGYVDAAIGTAPVTGDGWVRTGDLGHLDSSGYLFLLGRTEEGLPEGLHSRPIEDVLTGHPAVMGAAVFAVPGPAGPVLEGAVVAREGQRPDLDELRGLVRASLGHDHEPRRLHLVDEIPCGPSGKPNKPALTSRFTHP
ncbi:class I adenylate-forming enzyme family protein [Actinomadura roseirufa]|uniref:class I adenylate-forming enzyme family protein n=1 Tax=Actinomadura roseirufa TaxID=2094049 RepID=UPI001040FEE8|nr:fatty acid--CoA ligase family protein [Actinomadura roseirufa]